MSRRMTIVSGRISWQQRRQSRQLLWMACCCCSFLLHARGVWGANNNNNKGGANNNNKGGNKDDGKNDNKGGGNKINTPSPTRFPSLAPSRAPSIAPSIFLTTFPSSRPSTRPQTTSSRLPTTTAGQPQLFSAPPSLSPSSAPNLPLVLDALVELDFAFTPGTLVDDEEDLKNAIVGLILDMLSSSHDDDENSTPLGSFLALETSSVVYDSSTGHGSVILSGHWTGTAESSLLLAHAFFEHHGIHALRKVLYRVVGVHAQQFVLALNKEIVRQHQEHSNAAATTDGFENLVLLVALIACTIPWVAIAVCVVRRRLKQGGKEDSGGDDGKAEGEEQLQAPKSCSFPETIPTIESPTDNHQPEESNFLDEEHPTRTGNPADNDGSKLYSIPLSMNHDPDTNGNVPPNLERQGSSVSSLSETSGEPVSRPPQLNRLLNRRIAPPPQTLLLRGGGRNGNNHRHHDGELTRTLQELIKT